MTQNSTVQNTSTQRIKTLVTLAMLAAMAYAIMFVGRIPISSVEFLKYDPKDIVIAIGAFLYGPLAGVGISVVVSFVEMVTVSTTGIIGFVMNVLASCFFVCPAAIIYKRKHTLSSAIIGLILGVIGMTSIMLLWNYAVTPLYMGVPREQIAKMLVPVFLPFNLLKAGLNAAFTMMLYKPVVKGLRKANLIPESSGEKNGKINLGVILASAVVLATCILLILAIKGII